MWSFLFPFFPFKTKTHKYCKKQTKTRQVRFPSWTFSLDVPTSRSVARTALWSCFITRLNKANSSYWLLKRRSWRRERVIAGSPPAVLLDWAGWTWRRKTNKQPRDQQNIPASLNKWEPDIKNRHLLANVGWVLKWTHQTSLTSADDEVFVFLQLSAGRLTSWGWTRISWPRSWPTGPWSSGARRSPRRSLWNRSVNSSHHDNL